MRSLVVGVYFVPCIGSLWTRINGQSLGGTFRGNFRENLRVGSATPTNTNDNKLQRVEYCINIFENGSATGLGLERGAREGHV
jgi:hypothetical protein